jgi:hypothetical protein
MSLYLTGLLCSAAGVQPPRVCTESPDRPPKFPPSRETVSARHVDEYDGMGSGAAACGGGRRGSKGWECGGHGGVAEEQRQLLSG